MKFLLSTALLLLLVNGSLAADTPPAEEGFVSLFDGKTLDGWKIGDNAEIFGPGRHDRDGVSRLEPPPRALVL